MTITTIGKPMFFGANHSVDNFQDSFSHPFKNRWGNFSQVIRTPQKNSHRISVSSSDGFETKSWQFLLKKSFSRLAFQSSYLQEDLKGPLRGFVLLMCLLHWKQISCIGESPVVATWSESSIHLVFFSPGLFYLTPR